MGSSLTRDGTRVRCIGWQTLNPWAAREVPQVQAWILALPPPGCVTSGEGLNLPEPPHSLFLDLCFCTHLPGEHLSFGAGARQPCSPTEPGPSFSLGYCFITLPGHPSRNLQEEVQEDQEWARGGRRWGVEARGDEPGKEKGLGTGQAGGGARWAERSWVPMWMLVPPSQLSPNTVASGGRF